MNQKILLVGAGGWLGRQTLDHLRDAGADVRVLLRGGEAHPKAAGIGRGIVAGDLTDPDSLMRATEEINTIVSTVQGGSDIMVDGQAALAAAGACNGASRMFTSDYSVRFDCVTEAQHLFLRWRARAREGIAATGLPQINPLAGAFMEMLEQPFFGLTDWREQAVTYWGDPDQTYGFTHTGDAVAFVAAAAMTADTPAGDVEVVGDRASPRRLAELATESAGLPFKLRRLGDLDALDHETARRQAASPNDPSPWAALQYHRLMANGVGALRTHQNTRFPQVSPRSIRQWLATRTIHRSE